MQKTGTLKTFLHDRGFGFFQASDGDVFAHVHDFQEARLTPQVGELYRFRVVINPRKGKPMASDIEAVKSDAKTQETELAWLSHQQEVEP